MFYRNRYMSSGDIPQIINERRGGVPGRDQYTKLLLHCDGVQNSGAVIDSSLYPHPVQGFSTTTNTPPLIDATQSMFGGYSLYVPAGARYLVVPDHADWNYGTGDFTIDFWVRWNSLPSGTSHQALWSQAADASNLSYCILLYRAGSPTVITINAAGTGYHLNDVLTVAQAGSGANQTLLVTQIDGNGGVTGIAITNAGSAYSVANALATTVAPAGGSGCKVNITVIANYALQTYVKSVNTVLLSYYMGWSAVVATWYHISIVRYGNVWSMYINGTLLVASLTVSLTYPDYSSPLYIGIQGTPGAMVYPFNGWIDEFRISKGIARWTTNFTPPAMAYI